MSVDNMLYAVYRKNYMQKFSGVDVLVCWRFGLSTFRSVDVLVCRRFGLSTFRFVDVSVCRRFGCRRFGLSTFWLVTCSSVRACPNHIPATPDLWLYYPHTSACLKYNCCICNGGYFSETSLHPRIQQDPVTLWSRLNPKRPRPEVLFVFQS